VVGILLGRVHTSGWAYTPGWVYRRVYHGRCISPCTYPGCTMVDIHLPVHTLGIPPWVHTTRILVMTVLVSGACGGARRGVRRPWAQQGRNPWVGASQPLRTPKGVRVVRPLCAELLRPSGRLLDNDWIDEGSPYCISPMFGHVAHSPPYPSGHPIVAEKKEERDSE